MKKKNVWVSSDGKEFTEQEACIAYEKTEGFYNGVVDFVQKHMLVSTQQAKELVEQLEPFWNLIRDNAMAFQEVLDMAKPKKRRGRPPEAKKLKHVAPTLQEDDPFKIGFEIAPRAEDATQLYEIPSELEEADVKMQKFLKASALLKTGTSPWRAGAPEDE
jgi:hypothetical protein